MKKGKKIVGLILSMVMLLAMAMPVAADEQAGSITVKNAQAGETYKLYKMLDLSVNDEHNAFSYTVNKDWTAFFTGNGDGAAYVTIDAMGYVSWAEGMDTADKVEEFGKLAAAHAETLTPVVDPKVAETDGSSIVFANLESGYYLITSTNGTLAIVDTTPTAPNPSIEEKNKDATLDKTVKEDSTGNYVAENSAQIGDTVDFQVVIHAQKGAKDYVMHDTMEDGLTFDGDSVVIKDEDDNELTAGTDYTVEVNTQEDVLGDSCTFHIIFKQDYLDKITVDTTLTVTYSAILNEKADLENGEANTAVLKWGDASSVEGKTTTKTYQFEVLKYAATDTTKNPLAGATFQLKDADGNVMKLIKVSDTEYRVANGTETGAVDSFTTVAAGNIVIKGVDLDTYTLVETEAPDGYNKLAEGRELTVTAGETLTVEIANNTGAELPSTGGIGTRIFYIAGGILLVGAGILLVVRRRMNAEK